MIAILQRVTEASVSIHGQITASCGQGFLILLGVACGDLEADARILAEKIAVLRVFEDENGKMNRSLGDIGGSVLVVPNFTLLASCRRGTRPDFMGAERPEKASVLFDYFFECIREKVPHAERGVFGAEMFVSLVNDGPITIPLDSETLKLPKSANRGHV